MARFFDPTAEGLTLLVRDMPWAASGRLVSLNPDACACGSHSCPASTPEGMGVHSCLPLQCLAYLFAHGPEPQNWLCRVIRPGVVAPVILETLQICLVRSSWVQSQPENRSMWFGLAGGSALVASVEGASVFLHPKVPVLSFWLQLEPVCCAAGERVSGCSSPEQSVW